MIRAAALLCLLLLGACDDGGDSDYGDRVGKVILFNYDGQAEKSDVFLAGSRCWVAWYKGITKVVLRGDGTAIDGPLFKYKWTLDRIGPDDVAADRAWFAKNCREPMQ